MNDLRKALLNAGVIDKKNEKRFRHEERVRKKELGRDGLEDEKKAQEQERAKREAKSKAEVKAAQQEHDRRQKELERAKTTYADLRTRAIREKGGPRRFHYRDADRYLPYLSVSPETSRRLEGGELALVGDPEAPARVLIVPRDVAERLRGLHPDLIFHLAGR